MREMLEYFITKIGLREQIDLLRYKINREDIWKEMRGIRIHLHREIRNQLMKAEVLERITGLALTPYDAPDGVKFRRDGEPLFWVHSVREARRQVEDGRVLNQVFITILQKETVIDDVTNEEHTIRCGSTLVIDLDKGRVRYVVRKGLRDSERLKRTLKFLEEGGAFAAAPTGVTYLGESDEVFASLHSEPVG